MNDTQFNDTQLGEKEREILRVLCKRSYYKFFTHFWPALESENLADNFHVKYLCDELQEIAERVFRREPLKHNLIINISPGETKSSICTVFFPVWCWVHDPSLRIITSSYSLEGLSIPLADKSKRLIKSDLFQEVFGEDVRIKRGSDNKKTYETPEGGMRITAGSTAGVLGKHAHIVISDDPLNRLEANSPAIVQKSNEHVTKGLSTRKTDVLMAPTILIMQRLSEEDTTAHCLKIWDEVKHIRLPADNRYKISPPELEEFYTQDGELKVMNPYRKPSRAIKKLEREMTLTEAAGQLGQDPRPAEGNILKKSWFSQRFTLSWLDQFAARKRETIKWCAAVDGAYTKNTNNSATGVLVFAVYEGKLYLRNYRKFFLEFPELIDQLPAFLISNGVDLRGTVYVEPKATGKSLVQTLRSKGGLNIVEDKPPEGTQQMQGKILRTSNAAPFLRGMGATLLDGIDWEEFIYDCTAFPNAKHSDLVDALTMAVDKVENEVDWVGLYGDVM